MQFNTLSLITISGILLSTFLTIGIHSFSSNKKSSALFLCFIVLSNVSIINIGIFIYTNNFRIFPHILSFSTIAAYLLGPFFLFYTNQLLFQKKIRKQLIHLVVVLLIISLYIPYIFSNGAEKVEQLNQFINGTLPLRELVLYSISSTFPIFYMSIYYLFSLKKIIEFRKLNKTLYSNYRNVKSNWVLYTCFSNIFTAFSLMIAIIISIIIEYNFNIFNRFIPVIVTINHCVLSIRILLNPDLFFKTNIDINSNQITSHSNIIKNIDNKPNKKIKVNARIGLLLTTYSSFYERYILSGIREAAIHYNITLTIFTCGSFSENKNGCDIRSNVYSQLKSTKLDGLIISTKGEMLKLKPNILELIDSFPSYPKILIGKQNHKYSSVNINNSGLYSLITHLIKIHNYRKIAFIRGPNHCPDASERYEIYKRVLKDNRIDFKEELVYYGNYQVETGNKAVCYFFENLNDIEAIVCTNDYQAIGAYNELISRDKKIPDDIIITGFDNILESNYNGYNLTTVHQNIIEMSYIACSNLISALTNKTKPESMIINSELLIRESCGCKHNEHIRKLPLKNKTHQYEIFSNSNESNLNWFRKEVKNEKTYNGTLDIIKSFFPVFGINYFRIFLQLEKIDITGIENKKDCILEHYNDNKYKIFHSEIHLLPIFYEDKYLGYLEIFNLPNKKISQNHQKLVNYEKIAKILAVWINNIKDINIASKNKNGHYQPTNLTKLLMSEIKASIIDLMETEKPYHYSNFCLKDLSDRLNYPRNTISFVLNNCFNQSFNNFINEYRVNEVKEFLKSDKKKDFSMLDLAYETGFESKATFNRAFKKITSLTPSEYYESKRKIHS